MSEFNEALMYYKRELLALTTAYNAGLMPEDEYNFRLQAVEGLIKSHEEEEKERKHWAFMDENYPDDKW